MRWLGKISAADMVTLCSGLTGFLAITYIQDGKFMVASALIILAIILDGLDGIVARKMGSSHNFGRYLDSISDSISFCFAPALLLYSNYYDPALGSAWESMPNALAVISSMIIGLFGVLRLARYSSKNYKINYFLGIPTPAMALGTLMICSLFGKVDSNPFTFGYYPYHVFTIIIILSFLMLVDVPFPKMRGLYLVLAGIAGVLISIPFLFVIVPIELFSMTTLSYIETAGFVPLLLYMILGPIYLRKKISRKRRAQSSR